jgi:hypothetical protein
MKNDAASVVQLLEVMQEDLEILTKNFKAQ